MFRDKRRLRSWIAIGGTILLALAVGYFLGITYSEDSREPLAIESNAPD